MSRATGKFVDEEAHRIVRLINAARRIRLLVRNSYVSIAGAI